MSKTSSVTKLVLLGAVVCLLAGHMPVVDAKKKRSTKDWSKIDTSSMDKEWEEGDDPIELKNSFEALQDLERKKQTQTPQFDEKNPKAYLDAVKNAGISGGKSGMMFIDLKEKQSDGSDWTDAAQNTLAGAYTRLLMTAGQNSEVYNIGSKQLLISVTRGWIFNEVLKFVLSRPEVSKAVFNNKEYYPGQFDDDEDL